MPLAPTPPPIAVPAGHDWGRLPGVLLCIAVTLVAMALERLEVAVFGRAWLEALCWPS